MIFLIKELCNVEKWLRLISDIFFQIKLIKINPFRWFIHVLFFFSFLELFFIGSIGNKLTKMGIWSVTKDTAWFAFLNDFCGLVIMCGLILMLIRRMVFKNPQLINTTGEIFPLFWLLLIVVTGYFVEGLRFLKESTLQDSTNFAFMGNIFSIIMEPLNLNWPNLHSTIWWGHIFITFGFIAYIPYGRFFHMFSSPLSIFLSNSNPFTYPPQGGLANEESINRFSVKELIELDACTNCGECLVWCEAHSEVRMEHVTPRGKINNLKTILKKENSILNKNSADDALIQEYSKGVFDCTLCGRCNPVCPVNIGTVSIMKKMREDLYLRDKHPEKLNLMRDADETEYNILGYPNEERALWLDFMEDVPDNVCEKERAEVLYFVGCMSSFSPAIQNVPQAFLRIILNAGENVAVLGEREWCCGFPLIAGGMRELAFKFREHNINEIKRLGAKKIVFNCPSCYLTWKQFYNLEGIELLHSTEYINTLIKQGLINLKAVEGRFIYHDPCDLARNVGVYEPPREAINSIPGINFREFENNRDKGFCCGGGGVLEPHNPDLGKSINKKLITLTECSGANTLITACPQCMRMSLTGKKELGTEIKIMDICELIVDATVK
ncbi:MAG: putative iron sulfur protein [Candidatus Scalindua rubra]|uniref:Putative iron sulfur protein n=1 Tax=Candidatus Scalindua rubra TaxID=1872076 RepID=A0A1E3XDH6_9BACT|nr:MAG: putative iron sulfur protein [Candidatus Scalindua rubra]